MTRKSTVGLLAVLTAACATADPTPPLPAPPLASNYRAEAERVVSSGLRDPGSAIYDFRQRPYRLECDRGVFGPKMELWTAEVWVNARNGYGGYTGPQPYSVLFVPDHADGGARIQANRGQNGGAITSFSGICRRASSLDTGASQ